LFPVYPLGAVLPSSEARGTDEHTAWIAKKPQEKSKSIQSCSDTGWTLRVFNQEGGISTRTRRRRLLVIARTSKVDVGFEAVGELESRLSQSPKGSDHQPPTAILEWSIID